MTTPTPTPGHDTGQPTGRHGSHAHEEAGPAHRGELANRLMAIFESAGPLEDAWTKVAHAVWNKAPHVTPHYPTADELQTGRYGSDDWFAVHEDINGKRTPTAYIGAGFDERVVCDGLDHDDADLIVRAVNAARIASGVAS